MSLGSVLESSKESLEALFAFIEGVAANLNQVRHEFERHLIVKYFAAVLDRLYYRARKAEGRRGQGLTDDLLVEREALEESQYSLVVGILELDEELYRER